MRCLITGGCGFIGSHLAEYLAKRGDEVRIIDDLSTGNFDNILNLPSTTFDKTYIQHIDYPAAILHAVYKVDIIFHLAATVGVKKINDNRIETLENNINSTKAVLEAANGIPVFIASTSEVYGKSTKVPFKEDSDLVLGPTTIGRWGYAASKITDEFLALAYHKEKNQPVTIGRLFNTIGPRQTEQYGMVVPTFFKQALSSEPITVHGDGRQVRCFSDVADTVESIVRLMDCKEANGQVVNIGNDHGIRINMLAMLIKDITQSKSEIKHIPHESVYGSDFEDIYYRLPCVDKLEKLTGFRSQTTLWNMLSKIHESMKKETCQKS